MCMSTIFGGDIQVWSETWPMKTKCLQRCHLPRQTRNFQAFLGIIYYLGLFSPSTEDISESLRQLTSAKTEWTWNVTYPEIFDKSKSILKDAYMKFYDETKPLYIETDASGVALAAALLQTRNNTSCPRDGMPDNSILRSNTFVSKILTATEKIQLHRKRSNRHTIQIWEISPILFCEKGEYHYRS